MGDLDRVTLAHVGPYNLASRVILGAVDVAAVGTRVLMSLDPPPGWTVHEMALELRGLQHHASPSGSRSSGSGAGATASKVVLGGSGHEANEESHLRPVLAVATGEAPPGRSDGGDATASASSSAVASPPAPAVAMLRSFYARAGPQAEISLLILNTVVPEASQAEVAVAVLELLEGGRDVTERAADTGACPELTSTGAADRAAEAEAEAGSGCGGEERSISIVGAMLLPHLTHPAALYQHNINGATPLDPTLPLLLQPPIDATAVATAAAGGGGGSSSRVAPIRVRDGLLAALFHVLDVSGTPASCLLAPGYKPPAATPLDLPGSISACDVIGTGLEAALGLKYNREKCRTVRALYKWFVPERFTGSDVMYL